MYGLGRLPALWRGLQTSPHHADMAGWRDTCLTALLEHGIRHVPYVQDLFSRNGMTSGDVRTVAELTSLPVTTKCALQQAGEARVVAQNIPAHQLLDRSTSGSTGERMIVKRTWFEERLLNTFRRRAVREYGVTSRDRIGEAHYRIADDPRDDQTLQRLAHQCGRFRRHVFDTLSDPYAAQAAAAFDPHILTGMTGAIARLIDDAAKGGHLLRPRCVITTGELLTEPLRQRIAGLGVPLYDVYGCNECNLLAWQCPQGDNGYHVLDDSVIIEILRPDGSNASQGEWGDVVVTSLFSYAMPIIRYAVGDIALQGANRCGCGAPFSTLQAIKGRTIDCFTLGSGRLIHPWEIHNAIRPHLAGLRQFQMIQTAPDAIDLHVVPLKTLPDGDLQGMQNAGNRVLAGRALLTVKLVTTIAPGPSGKCQPFVSYRTFPAEERPSIALLQHDEMKTYELWQTYDRR